MSLKASGLGLQHFARSIGDVGRNDEDGYFWIIGRTDDILFCDG